MNSAITGTKEKRWCITALTVRFSLDVTLRSDWLGGLVTALSTRMATISSSAPHLNPVGTRTAGAGWLSRPGQDSTFSTTSTTTSSSSAHRPSWRQRPRAIVVITARSRKK